MIYEFSPKQDLHGYEKPWAPGAGVNVWNEEWEHGYWRITDGAPVADNRYIRCKDFIPVEPDTTYYMYEPNATSDKKNEILMFDENKTLLGYLDVASRTTFTVSETCAFIKFYMHLTYGGTYKNDISINYPATVTTYSPYSNICPPEGYNIWDPTNAEMIQVYSGYVDAEARKIYLHPVYEEYDGEELVGPWMSSMDEYTEEGTPTTGAFVIDFGGEVTEYDITDFMLQTLLDSLGIRRFITSGAMLLNSLMDQAQGRVRSEAELLNRSLPIHVIAIGKELPTNLVIKKPVSDVLPVLPGKTKI